VPASHVALLRGINVGTAKRIAMADLRGVMTGLPDLPGYDAPAATSLPQGSVVMIAGGVERLVHAGGGGTRA